MRAYLAVIKDSFREAFASKILWVLIILISLFLLLLAGLSTRPTIQVDLRGRDIVDQETLAERMRDASSDTPVGRIRDHLPSDLRDRLRGFRTGAAADPETERERRNLFRKLRNEIADQVREEDFASRISIPPESLSEEGQALAARADRLSGQDQLRLNRLVLEATLPDDIYESTGEVVTLTYLGFTISDDMTATQEELEEGVNGLLQVFIFFCVSVAGTLIAIVVTAPIVPRMFESGAIDLLLSKPVARSLLFLSKFFGGCAFTLVNAAFLIGGMWLVIGLRLGVWSDGLLLSIPVYLFLFVLYYSISAATGVVYRGPIISVVMVVVFWFLCFIVGASKGGIESIEVNPTAVREIVPVGDADHLAVNKMGHVHEWSETTNSWERVFVDIEYERRLSENIPPPGRIGLRAAAEFPYIGLAFDSQTKRLIVLTKNIPFPRYGSGPARLLAGRHDDDWSRQGGTRTTKPPHNLMITSKGDILSAGTQGIERFEGNPESTAKTTRWLGMDFSLGNAAAGQFDLLTPAEMTAWKHPFDAALDPSSGVAFVFSAGTIVRVAPRTEDGKTSYEPGLTRDLETEEPALLAVAGNRLLVALGDGDYRLLDTTTLEPVPVSLPVGLKKPRQVTSSPDGRYIAVVSHASETWLIDVTTGTRLSPGAISGDTHAVAFDADNHLLVGDLSMRVTRYSLPDFQLVSRRDPSLGTLHAIYRYLVLPLYTVFPKPGELNNVITRLFTKDDTVTASGDENDLQETQYEIDIQGPIISNAVFLLVVLTLTCVYISRKDF